jgi:CO/xanthine dehydrogenase Mo-binding subunit
MLALSFKISESDIEVNIPFVGEPFGGKAGIHLVPLATLLSKAANGAPVKLFPTREEKSTTSERAGMGVTSIPAQKIDGKIMRQSRLRLYSGAYADYGVNVGKTSVYSGIAL